jgi:hypothetical protein
VGIGTYTLTLTSSDYYNYYYIQDSAFNNITMPGASGDSGKYFVFNNQTTSFLFIGLSYSSGSGPGGVDIPPLSTITFVNVSGNYVLF